MGKRPGFNRRLREDLDDKDGRGAAERLAEELKEKPGRLAKIVPAAEESGGGALQATRELFLPSSVQFMHGRDLTEVVDRVRATLRQSEEGIVFVKQYSSGAVLWCGRTQWSATRAAKALFSQVVRRFRLAQ